MVFLPLYTTDDDLAAAVENAGAPTSNPVMTINTAFEAFPQDTTNYVNCMVSLTGVPEQADVYGAGRVRGRGHNTWELPKKPFKVKLDDSKPLLGLPTSKDWALLANYNDPANLSNALAFTLGQMATGLPWTPHYGYVDLFFNGGYYGQFQLTESADIAATRVNVTKASGTTGLGLTGAYLMEINVEGDAGKSRYTTTHGVGVNADDPDGANTTQWAYVTTWLQTFEDVLYGDGFDDPDTGFRAYIDVPSFIDWYLVEEFAANQEGSYASSCKLYKTRDTADVLGKLYMGPLWDFDRSFGVLEAPIDYSILDEQAGAPIGAVWHRRMIEDPAFKAEVGTRWATLKAAIAAAGGMSKLIDNAVARVASAQVRDAARWRSEPYDYATLMGDTKAFVAARQAWMDATYPAS